MGVEPCGLASRVHASIGILKKGEKRHRVGYEVGRDLFLNVQCPHPQDLVPQNIGKQFFMYMLTCRFFFVFLLVWVSFGVHTGPLHTGMETGHAVRLVRDLNHYSGCHFLEHTKESRLADGEDACSRLHGVCLGELTFEK